MCRESRAPRAVDVNERILARNDSAAAHNAEHFRERESSA